MQRWKLRQDKESIIWDKDFDGHLDFLEMSGLGASFIVTYGTDKEGTAVFSRYVVFPTLRTVPNDTHASYQCEIRPEFLPLLKIDGLCDEQAVSFMIDGNLHAETKRKNVSVTRVFFPSTSKRVCIEEITLLNEGEKPVFVEFSDKNFVCAHSAEGVSGENLTYVFAKGESFYLSSGQSKKLSVIYFGVLKGEKFPEIDVSDELKKRNDRLKELKSPLVLETGTELDSMFALCKIRAGESVFNTKNGVIHCPGGYSYYASVWCNDQCEYSGPYFAFTGDGLLKEAALNGYRWFIPYMNEDFAPIPSSVIAEGTSFWNGAGDRGDAAMFLYGATHFCLINGDRETAKSLWDAIKWCAEYCRRKTNESGVIASDSDELENRLPSGNANLCTSSLCLMGLSGAASMAREFSEEDLYQIYSKRADTLEKNIDLYFSSRVEGYKTYKYYKENEVLRSWICMPLCAGIFTRAQGTADALLSPKLWHKNGVLSQSGENVYWDRSTLYAFRGIFKSGLSAKAAPYFLDYCRSRLFYDRVPYPIEAYPEGNRRHLSAESALFIQIVLFGILGIVPKGFNCFEISPSLCDGISHISLKNIHAFGKVFDIYADTDGWTISTKEKEIKGKGRKTVTF